MPYSLFDLAGPIMVGPSSSHTAGACKIGQIARALFKGTPNKVSFYLYGSFATVYQGHATDKALLAGVMKLKTSDPQIKNAFQIADRKNLKYEFIPLEISAPEHHPNTVRIILKNHRHKLSVVGSSVGGGEVKITFINDIPINLDMMAGRFFSLIIGHKSEVSLDELIQQIKKKGGIIEKKQTFSVKNKCITILSFENFFMNLPEVLELEKLKDIEFVKSLTKLLKK